MAQEIIAYRCSDGSIHPHELRGAAVHWEAAHKLVKKLGWSGTMQAGSTKDGYVFVFIDGGDQFTI